mmetsp:Transcript_159516/g.294020  ORF Transcript_159516/g.294020 Transcript_159516/m.294020 type:complete len:224 (+) Transcript_159516:752-1423(+)
MQSLQLHAAINHHLHALGHNTGQTANGPSEGSTDIFYVFDKCEGCLRLLSKVGKQSCIVVRAESKSIQSTASTLCAADQGRQATTRTAILAVSEEHNGRHWVALSAALCNLNRHFHSTCDACASTRSEPQDRTLCFILPIGVHAAQAKSTPCLMVECNDAEAVLSTALSDHKTNCILHQSDLVPRHGPADIKDANDIERLSLLRLGFWCGLCCLHSNKTENIL